MYKNVEKKLVKITVLAYNITKGSDKIMNMFNNALLKECRKRQGLTQHDASKKIGVARTTYADYENGKIQPPMDKVQRICEWLDMPIDKLMIIENNTGIELSKFKTKNRMTDAEKIQTINRIQTQANIINTFDDIATTVRNMEIKQNEKDLIINLLDYIAQSYMLRKVDLELYDRINRAKEND